MCFSQRTVRMISSKLTAKDLTHLYNASKESRLKTGTGRKTGNENALLRAGSYALRRQWELGANVCDNTRYTIYRQSRLSWGHFNFFLTHYSENLSVFRGCSDTRKGLKILKRIMIDIDKYACISSSSLKNPTGDQARQPLALHITNNKGKTPSIKCLTDHCACVVIRKWLPTI